MAFRIVKDARAWWPMYFNGVTDDGKVVENSIELRFVRLGRAEFNAMFGEDSTTKTADVFDRVVRDWRGVEDETGAPLTFTPDAVAALLDLPNVMAAFSLAYVKFWCAIAETRLGNSSPPLAGGPVAADPIAAPDATPPA